MPKVFTHDEIVARQDSLRELLNLARSIVDKYTPAQIRAYAASNPAVTACVRTAVANLTVMMQAKPVAQQDRTSSMEHPFAERSARASGAASAASDEDEALLTAHRNAHARPGVAAPNEPKPRSSWLACCSVS